jgi:hypothetical protein
VEGLMDLTDLKEIRGCQLEGKPTISEDGFARCAIKITEGRWQRIVTEMWEKIHDATTNHQQDFVVVPPFVPNCDTPKVRLSCSNGLLKSAMAVVQLLFACLTLYRTKGEQVEM